ncbi:MAG: glycosyl transferase, group 1 [Sphingomonas bacterium]|uniref:glycosyltransferase family 4 protein n=1 Tax=Sphingomonas bacterium TaxID=1895847 RepID=UPI002618C9B8|nr:glycosyltransferase family 4 protein [Sphingomonas bacterium]MDB5706264.1 glycosyl transferase, group 1 [Sphingomonas bacterium]
MADLPPILHILPAEPFGGLQVLVIELARAQRAEGKVAKIVLLAPSERVEARCRAAGIEPVVLTGPKLGRMVALARIVRQREPAILHSHCEPIWATVPLAMRGAAWMVHQHVYASQKSIRDRAGNLIRRFFARRFVGITHSVAQSFVEQGLVAAERTSVVHNGLDLATLPSPVAGRNIAPPFTVVFVGRAVREKGLFDFIEAADLLRDETGLRFVIAGEGADLAEARAVITARGLDDRIAVLGFVHDTAALWSEADMLLMLSTREPFGLVILEAIASGVAVLGYDIPSGGSEVMSVIPGCRMVAAFSIANLADAVREAANDPAALRSQVATGRAIVASQFSLGRMEKNVAREYERLAHP